MRDFCKFSPEFWSGVLAEKLKKLGRDALLLATYLQTNRHSNMLGVYYLPIAYMSHDTAIPFEDINRILAELSEINFSHYDYQHSYVWVVELGLIQTGGALKGLDKRVIQLQKQYEALPMLCFLSSFYEKYHQLYHLMGSPQELHPLAYPTEGASKTLRSKYKKKEKNKHKEKNKDLIVLPIEADRDTDPVCTVFEHWKKVLNHSQAILDVKRRKIIFNALSAGYSIEQLCQAITGCSNTPHNMGVNEAGQRFDGLHIIFKSADQIDRFIRNYHTPPRKPTDKATLFERNQASAQAWIAEEESKDANL